MAMPAFEYAYSYRISVDEEMMQRYADYPSRFRGVKSLFEIRSSFIVKGRRSSSSSEILIDSERYAIEAVKNDSDDYLHFFIGLRLKDYWMPEDQVHRLVAELLDFAKQTDAQGGGGGGLIQAAVDLDVCTVQREGEETGATVERALRPELLPPLYLYPTANPKWGPDGQLYYEGDLDVTHLVGKLKNVRVEDASSASAAKATVMEACGVCGREPIAGGQVSTISCGHAFHYSCIAIRLLEEERNSCPICNRRPAAYLDDMVKTFKDLEGDIFSHDMRCFLGDNTDISDLDEDVDSDMEDWDEDDMEDCDCNRNVSFIFKDKDEDDMEDCDCNHNVSFIFKDDDK